MTNLLQIDWQRIALNIQNSGLSLETAAKKVEMDGRTLQRIAREGGHPRWRQAVLLLDLHVDRCPDRHREIIPS